jgi:hypothetical protein
VRQGGWNGRGEGDRYYYWEQRGQRGGGGVEGRGRWWSVESRGKARYKDKVALTLTLRPAGRV